MLVFRGFQKPATSPAVLTLGNFDGVHLGHMALLQRLTETAAQLGIPGAVVTFEPHPREFFAPGSAPARLSSLREKLEHFAEAGVDQVYLLRFNHNLASLSAEAFVQQVLVNGMGAQHVIIGDDFRFGTARQGDFAYLEQAGNTLGFSVESVPSILVDGLRVSSSAVRQALQQGNMEQAAALLRRPYSMAGRVVHGRKLGRQLGFATANIYIRHNPLVMTGVFAVRVRRADGHLLDGVANLGIRPTLGGTRPLLEIHLLDFEGDLYGAHLSVQFMHKLRDELKFSNLSALQAQIAQDVVVARNFFCTE